MQHSCFRHADYFVHASISCLPTCSTSKQIEPADKVFQKLIYTLLTPEYHIGNMTIKCNWARAFRSGPKKASRNKIERGPKQIVDSLERKHTLARYAWVSIFACSYAFCGQRLELHLEKTVCFGKVCYSDRGIGAGLKWGSVRESSRFDGTSATGRHNRVLERYSSVKWSNHLRLQPANDRV